MGGPPPAALEAAKEHLAEARQIAGRRDEAALAAARAAGTERIDLQIRRIDFKVDLLHFRQDGHGDGAGMDAPGGLRVRHALDAVDAALEFQVL